MFNPDINFILNNELIAWEISYQYLWMLLDSKLLWQKHIKETYDKAEKATSILNIFLAWESCQLLKNKLFLY